MGGEGEGGRGNEGEGGEEGGGPVAASDEGEQIYN